jgi:pyruvate-ferredoxin/flavodoxin oxidoreductase
MADPIRSGARWLRELWRRSPAEPDPRPGIEALPETGRALEELECSLCEDVAGSPGLRARAAIAAARASTGAATRNAFGRPLHRELGAADRGSVARATGMTLAGLRATVFLDGATLSSLQEDLLDAADRLAPLVLHTELGETGHADYHRVADAGHFQALATSGQEALDLTLLAHWLAERALLPGLVATDCGTFERLQLPDEELVRSCLGEPDEPLPCPTEGQRLLFGADRPRLLPWFDPERPVATGGLRSAAEQTRARLGRTLFFRDHLPDLAQRGMQEVARLTGRPLSSVGRYELDDAELVLVGQGAGVQALRAAADSLRRARGWKVGVLGITWLRPFPADAIAEALEGRRAIAVLEMLDEPLAGRAPLLREIEAASDGRVRCVSAICSAPGPAPEALAALCDVMRGPDPPRRLRVDRMGPPESSGFPRRDALIQSLANAYPELRATDLPASEPRAPEREDVRGFGILGLQRELSGDAAHLAAEMLAEEAGPFVRGGLSRSQPGVLDVRLRAAPVDFPDPGARAPLRLLLVATRNVHELGRPLSGVAREGTLLLAASDSSERLWTRLPLAWRTAVRERGLRLLACEESLESGIEALRACLRGEEAALVESGALRRIEWRELGLGDDGDRELPALVRRIEAVRPSHDSLPRFFGEHVQPEQAGRAPELPDPLDASGAVPASASALQPAASAAVLPVLDPGACTGCGRCWSACPDSALGATVLGIETLLTRASELARSEGKAADALRRAHRQLAARLGGQLAKQDASSLTAEDWVGTWSWLAERMGISDEERPAYEAAFQATVEVLLRLQPVITRPFFSEPERQKKGEGELLVLAVDSRACVGCGLCVSACPEDALAACERTEERAASHVESWRLWEALPDTAGPTLSRAKDCAEVGELAAVLLSRHCAQAQVGSAIGEPGSGERLAARLVAALVEYHAQRRSAALSSALETQHGALEQRVRALLAEGFSSADMDTLATALAGVAGGRAEISALGQRLDALGTRAGFDRRAVLRLARLAGELDRERHLLTHGEDGLGRARFGVVVARGSASEWAARYPLHPYYAPLTVAATPRGADLARGIARGLATRHTALVRSLQRAALEIDPPPDRRARLEAIEGLTWEALGREDRAACPPLLLLVDDAALLGEGFSDLARLLASDLPVKVVLLDERDGLDAGPEPGLVAMAQRRAFVLTASVAHPEHLARGVLDALDWSGPALLHLHAPSPSRHGFPPDATLERARLAVESRAHVLFRYDPSAEGTFGLRASLEGNPALDRDWGCQSFPEWAAGEGRFAHHFEPCADGAGPSLEEWLARSERERSEARPVLEIAGEPLRLGDPMARAAAERLAIWNTLRELCGVSSPFTERIRAAVSSEIEAVGRAHQGSVESELEARLAGLRSGTDPELRSRLTDRLLALAGYESRDPQEGDGS